MFRKVLQSRVTRFTVCYLVLFFAGLFSLPSVAEAAFIPVSAKHLPTGDRNALEQVRTALEEGLLTERLAALGLSDSEIAERIGSLTAQERAEVVSQLDAIQAGGNSVVGLLALALIVFLILKLTDKI
ncbi:MAG: PA2779 family protein [bacterium]|nr:MAG: PA2779 family protein [bacterium]